MLRPFVETISPSSKKKSVIFIACVNSPPGLFLKSRTYPLIFEFFSNFFNDFKNCLSLFSLKDFNLIYPKFLSLLIISELLIVLQ